MYKIAICSSNIQECSKIEDIILSYGKEQHILFEVDVYYCGENLLQYMENSNNIYDAIFINTELKKMDGVQLGKNIRRKYWVDIVSIVYFSSMISRALQLFEIMPSDFILKPFNRKSIHKALKLVISTIDRNRQKIFSFKIAGVTYKVPLEEILYFESKNKIVNIYTQKEKRSFYSTLGGIEEILGNQDFFHIHKSYLVNKQHVIRYYYDKVILTNLVELPISQTRRKEIKSILAG